MKPPPFEYVRARSLDEATYALAEAGEDAKVLAGGQSLVPMLNFRLARPTVLVDVGSVAELARIDVAGDVLHIGSMVRQRTAERSSEVASSAALVGQALRHVGHLQIRSRGTVGGSLAHADPAGELPAVVVALDAQLVARSVRGERTIAAADFFVGPYMTTLEPDEILTAVRIPSLAGWRTTFVELARRSGDFALAGVAVAVRTGDGGVIESARAAAIGVTSTPVRLADAEACLQGADPSHDCCEAAGAAAGQDVAAVQADAASADATYRRSLVQTLTTRAVRDLVA